jgi:phosphatidylglycerophosphate synthase
LSSTETKPDHNTTTRRPLKTRDAKWANQLAAWLIASRVSPNHISLMSIVFAALAGGFLCMAPAVSALWRSLLLLLAALCIQMRLLCNMLDGMVAVGSGTQSKAGEILNDFPDRISDCLIVVGAGYAIRDYRWGIELGWLAGVLAVMTAYVRVLGGSLNVPQSFMGPMAKPHRMAVMTAALVLAALVTGLRLHLYLVMLALIIVNVGCVITLWRRLRNILRGMASS